MLVIVLVVAPGTAARLTDKLVIARLVVVNFVLMPVHVLVQLVVLPIVLLVVVTM